MNKMKLENKESARDMGQAEKYLTFKLGEQEFGIHLLKVQEIINLLEITTIPQTPHYVKGIINLRGKIIPVIDLRLKLGMEEIPYNERTCNVVVEISTPNGKMPMSMVVDIVSEVIPIPLADIGEAPDFGTEYKKEFIQGVAKVNNSVKILLNIDNVLNDENLLALLK